MKNGIKDIHNAKCIAELKYLVHLSLEILIKKNNYLIHFLNR